MATHSSTLAWKIPWTEEPGRLLSMGSLPFTFHLHALEKEMATHSSILAWRTLMDRGARRATVHGVEKTERHTA